MRGQKKLVVIYRPILGGIKLSSLLAPIYTEYPALEVGKQTRRMASRHNDAGYEWTVWSDAILMPESLRLDYRDLILDGLFARVALAY